MTVVIALPALPSSNGASIIQTSNFALSSVYAEITYAAALARVKNMGQHLFSGFPGKDPGPSYHWYERSNMSSGSENLATIVATRSSAVNRVVPPLNTVASTVSRNVTLKSFIVEVLHWTPVRVTMTDGQIYHDVEYHSASATAYIDPETQIYAMPTNGYQALYEAVGFMLKPVAGTTPDYSNLYKAANGRNPL